MCPHSSLFHQENPAGGGQRRSGGVKRCQAGAPGWSRPSVSPGRVSHSLSTSAKGGRAAKPGEQSAEVRGDQQRRGSGTPRGLPQPGTGVGPAPVSEHRLWNPPLPSMESVAGSCQLRTALGAFLRGAKSPGKRRRATLCPRMLPGSAPSAERMLPTWALRCPARRQGQSRGKETKGAAWPGWGSGWWQKVQTDGRTDKPPGAAWCCRASQVHFWGRLIEKR